MAPLREWLTSEEVMDLTGATYRQLDYWADCGHIRLMEDCGGPHPGSGNFRAYPRTEVPVICLMLALKDTGIPPSVSCIIARRLLHGQTVRLSGGLLLTYAAPD